MKNIATMLILLAAFTQPVFADKGMRGKHMDRMINDLQLNSEQEPAVRQIMEEQHAKKREEMQAIHEQMKPKMEALHEETRQRLSTVLTEEQLQTFDSNAEKRHEKMRDRKNRWRNKGAEDRDD
jgi:Spy/CpxP family protein refolding chaperone